MIPDARNKKNLRKLLVFLHKVPISQFRGLFYERDWKLTGTFGLGGKEEIVGLVEYS